MSDLGDEVAVRRATASDAELLATLIEELNANQQDETGHVTVEAVRRDGFGAAPEFGALLAELGGEVVGYALYHPTWSTEVGERGLFLYDLYVRDAARGRGVGRALMQALAAIAKTEGRSFLWWTSKPWNRGAAAFYAGLGAVEEDIRAHAIHGEAFDRLAGGAAEG